MGKKVYQLKITLNDAKPPIWRQFLVDPDTDLFDLHCVVQSVMGWTNSHLHQFRKGRDYYAPKEFELDDVMDSRETKLNSLLKRVKDTISYDYDFGDSWTHSIVLEKIVEVDGMQQIPWCIKGKRECPPEDCGGIWGYEDLLAVISNPKHEEYMETMEWLGGEFDPEDFNAEKINSILASEGFGCFGF